YRKNNGTFFEAVGNVVIISKDDTIYGEVASLDQQKMEVKIEGNVRLIGKDMTLFGSHLSYDLNTGKATIRNARILNSQFNLVASTLQKISEDEYLATDAEFSTCKDCAESWSIFGKTIRVKTNAFVEIRHGLARVKAINVLYLPYIVLPIMSERKSGLLFPRISSRLNEGLSFEQPVFWAIDDSKDMTFSPTFWAKRGYGGDYQYRQRFNDTNWFEFNIRALSDKIYLPGQGNESESGREYFRYFGEVETHQQFSPNLNAHVRYTGAKDLDIVADHPTFTDQKIISSDFGLNAHVDWRQDNFNLATEANYLRNQLFSEADKFDKSYVQTLPRATFSVMPQTLFQSDIPMLSHISVGLDSSVTRFRQENKDEDIWIRNADRFTVRPYMQWNYFSAGPFSMKSHFSFDQHHYLLTHEKTGNAGKNAGIVRTELSFYMDKIFGLSYEENVPLKLVPEERLSALRREQRGLIPIKKEKRESNLIGETPKFERSLVRENFTQVRASYRHAQEFKLIHHYMTSENEYGNKRFIDQIQTSQVGWFDYEDAIRSQEFLFGADTTRTLIPPTNTAELQWRNNIVRKLPKKFSYLTDDKYLRDNFTYRKIGYFNVSQGYLLNKNEESSSDFTDRLTRLMIDTGFSGERWSTNLVHYYFHQENENIIKLNFHRRLDFMNLTASYNHVSFSSSNLNVLRFGGQVRPTDYLGFSMLKDMDFNANNSVRTTYGVDIMPNNNCWILSLNYRESITDSRFSFNILFNFGDDTFGRYRNEYFARRPL
ncbi:MAG TPA: hypothetical protein VKZ84_00330, partial [Bacteriovoracaceae bacterium]|nr:hypothetical protein [Bacteriovoracaceae bacterium]